MTAPGVVGSPRGPPERKMNPLPPLDNSPSQRPRKKKGPQRVGVVRLTPPPKDPEIEIAHPGPGVFPLRGSQQPVSTFTDRWRPSFVWLYRIVRGGRANGPPELMQPLDVLSR